MTEAVSPKTRPQAMAAKKRKVNVRKGGRKRAR